MPILSAHDYRPPLLLRNRHLNSVYPVFFRKIKFPQTKRERLVLRDGDFVDVDEVMYRHDQAVLLVHGFEGSAQSVYIQAMGNAFLKRKFDVFAMNQRGCSGEANQLFRSYHSGETEDLQEVINHVLSKGYEKLVVVAFSLGANILLKYLGEKGSEAPNQIKTTVAISAPCDLNKAEEALSPVYAYWFLKSLLPKIREKMQRFPDNPLGKTVPRITSIREFDDFYTAPVHGFKDVDDYYQKCSSIHFLKNIEVPTLLLTAQDDPFLSQECIPFDIAEKHEYLHLLSPSKGGHVAFTILGKDGEYWAEQKAADFVMRYVE